MDEWNVAPASKNVQRGMDRTQNWGKIYSLPVGISFMGTAYSEPTLIRLTYAFEKARQVRRPPEYLTSIDPLSLLD